MNREGVKCIKNQLATSKSYLLIVIKGTTWNNGVWLSIRSQDCILNVGFLVQVF